MTTLEQMNEQTVDGSDRTPDTQPNSAMPNSSMHSYLALKEAIAHLNQRLQPFFNAYAVENQTLDPLATTKVSPGNEQSIESLPLELLPPLLNQMCDRLSLSEAECTIVLFCAGVELFPSLAARCASVHGSAGLAYVSVQIVIDAFGEPGLAALDPSSPLRTWQIVQLVPGSPMASLALSAIKLDRSVLHFLLGHSYQDRLFTGQIRTVVPQPMAAVPAAYQRVIDTVNRYWRGSQNSMDPIQICGHDIETQQLIASLLLPSLKLHQLSAASLPVAADELHAFCWHWQRQSCLERSALLVDCHAVKLNDAQRLGAIATLLQTTNTPIVLLASERLNLPTLPFTVEVPMLGVAAQKSLWVDYLSARLPEEILAETIALETGKQMDLQEALSGLVAQFNLSPTAITVAGDRAISALPENPLPTLAAVMDSLWTCCRTQSRTQLEGFARRIEPQVSWNDLVLAEKTVDSLRQIISQVRSRSTVYDQWEMGGRSRRGLGIAAMFYGLSGTGKTTAAELISKELNLDLYRIDLSAIISKYIGETEKNLEKIFTAAEAAGAILQFDEADAIVGKRSDVKDARDRYANMEVSYLLQRMEAYPGLTILTTNLPNSLDQAFLRRLRFSVEFKSPTYQQRMQIWETVYSAAVPTEGLCTRRLAGIDMTGATIRNVAMGAAFLAADADGPVTMKHLLRSLRAEYRKLGRQLIPKDIELWDPDDPVLEQLRRP